MASPSGDAPIAADRPLHGGSAIARLPTGTKLFLILSGALLPLALIAVFATLQTSRLADAELRARLRLAANESARSVAIELTGDMAALRVAMAALGSDPADAPSCARVQGVFAQQASRGMRFAIVGRNGRLICGEQWAGIPVPTVIDGVGTTVLQHRGIVLGIRDAASGTVAHALFPRAVLAGLGKPSGQLAQYSSALTQDGEELALQRVSDGNPLRRLETQETALGIRGLRLRMSVPSAPITSSLVVALLLPLLMWAAAAAIAWFVVDRLLIRPLRRLRASVAAYRPGEVIEPGAVGQMPAQEIRELGDTFRAISHTVARHEAGLAEGLVRQTKLTREVHHRVKNNLQVIASLINFHARGAQSEDATAAYASIQRRVDALAVVHRHHFAEMEDNRGLNLRTLLGELVSNIRASAPEGSSSLRMALDIEPYLVSQDVAVAISFLVTETVELAMSTDPAAQIRVSVKPSDDEGRAVLRVVSRALTDSDDLRQLVTSRYGRVMEGLSRQLRSRLHHDPMTGVYEIAFAVLGRD